MENVSLENRLKYHALAGKTKISIRLYSKQIARLVRDGYTVKRLDFSGCHEDQIRCAVSWNDALVGTPAYDMLAISQQNSTPSTSGAWEM